MVWDHVAQFLMHWWQEALGKNGWIAAFGLFGQAMFMSRFIVQWISSERAGRSVVPVTFWYFSLAGGALVLLYGLLKPDLVIIAGQLPGLVVYARNLHLIHKHKRAEAAAAT
ncbi:MULTISPECIES: lipid-A-disaccharide synthase N-terminal domain-containing protein [Nitrospirillum]|uniref:Lipid-A-disaccharide synthase-like uncharacterized protein n=1 Tax=Nitrospirillum amazonense TaxID=28077 RepID=A0A560HKA4_9PROT|nr:lipid-A-disaccharide synthase N-terminal domain-containing protein [Nitrospirillum amazonense]TWB23542.1 lipid-A-disaccharide synthase-like uncharacterized protein [Nitrospirillum amazonense]TWB46928.1 lipid-A-disaccharide synthase-like uncharacterized protein [Nitrospirillum amazonense]